MLRDWELLKVLNGISSGSGAPPDTVPTMEGAGAELSTSNKFSTRIFRTTRRCLERIVDNGHGLARTHALSWRAGRPRDAKSTAPSIEIFLLAGQTQ